MALIEASDWPWTDRKGRFDALRAGCFALVLMPAAYLAYQAFAHQLGSKPWTQAVHDTGTWALRILVITLAVTPLRRILETAGVRVGEPTDTTA